MGAMTAKYTANRWAASGGTPSCTVTGTIMMAVRM